jgi:hypothetical protein
MIWMGGCAIEALVGRWTRHVASEFGATSLMWLGALDDFRNWLIGEAA